jgi:hypothetical protein
MSDKIINTWEDNSFVNVVLWIILVAVVLWAVYMLSTGRLWNLDATKDVNVDVEVPNVAGAVKDGAAAVTETVSDGAAAVSETVNDAVN